MELEALKAHAENAEKKADWEDAAALYRQLVELAPDCLEHMAHLGWCLSRQKRYAEAVSLFEQLDGLEPTSAKWPYMAGYQYHDQQQWNKAVSWYERALARKPHYVVALYRKGYAHFQLRQWGDALRCFELCRITWRSLPDGPAKEKDRRNCAKAAYHQGELVMENPRLIENARAVAPELLREAIQLRASRWDEAASTLQTAVRKNERNHNGHFLLSRCLLNAEDWDGARRELTRAIELRQRNYQVPFPEAARELEKLEKEHPRSAASAVLLNRFEGIVRNYNGARGFGFIHSSGEQFFFHVTAGPPGWAPVAGMRVHFSVIADDRGQKAVRIAEQSIVPAAPKSA